MKITIRTFIILVVFIFFIPQFSLSDIAYSKNGRHILADKIWTENGKVICLSKGNMLSFSSEEVLKIELKEINIPEERGFRFDVWHSGMGIREILAVAKRNDIPLHKEGLYTTNKRYNPVTSSKYAKTATRYYYLTNLLGKKATVKLSLTPSSKRLHTLSIYWFVSNPTDRIDFEKEITDTLSAKYGPPKKRTDLMIFGKTKTWVPSSEIEIELQETVGNFSATYKDIEALALLKTEIQQTKDRMKQNYQPVDIGKF